MKPNNAGNNTWLRARSVNIVQWKRSHINPAFTFGSHADLTSRYQPFWPIRNNVYIRFGESERLLKSDVRPSSRARTLIGQSRFYFSSIGLIWLYFIRQWRKSEIEPKSADTRCWWYASFFCVIYDTVRGYMPTIILLKRGGVRAPSSTFKTKTIWHLRRSHRVKIFL